MAESFELFPGYRAEKLPEGDSSRLAYRIHGPRKAYHLMRAEANSEWLFALSSEMQTTKICGFAWFSDRDGTLKPHKQGFILVAQKEAHDEL